MPRYEILLFVFKKKAREPIPRVEGPRDDPERVNKLLTIITTPMVWREMGGNGSNFWP